ncbi:hypothetical protein CRG98_039088 [Punica granatum]|uniref:Uncharacterized protein n=1 Tax=Punica granatum TaxID=22663 RepID=A0A2I0I964_PUNGR|nr:hypothetical protein CRG98_039088 [Punica granatum]
MESSKALERPMKNEFGNLVGEQTTAVTGDSAYGTGGTSFSIVGPAPRPMWSHPMPTP